MILMNDFKAEPPELKAAMAAAAQRVIESGWYILGRESEAFERRWARALNVPHALGVGNGLDAIELILRALGIGPGDEVVTTPMTAFATVLAVLRAGATPVLADIDPQSALLDPASVERCLTPRTKAVLLVHLYGQLRQMERWMLLCGGAGIHLIEDCAQSHLARNGDRYAGSFGVAGAYSFYPTKNLGAMGDAGAVVTGDRELAERVARLRNYGQSHRYHHPELGMNSRLDEMQAALLSVRLDWLEVFTRRRREIQARLREGVRHPEVRLMAAPQQEEAHVHHLFAVCCERRDELQRHLADNGVQSLIHYPVPLHHQPPCIGLRTDPLGLQHAEAHARTCLSLPCHPQMSDADVDRVVDSVNRFAHCD
jgi:dTDP-4-amino-4,6-dideoxygalactose transaminase